MKSTGVALPHPAGPATGDGMAASSYSTGSRRRRTTSLALAVAAHVLVILLLLRLGPKPVERWVEDTPLSTFTVAPESEDVPEPADRARTQARSATRSADSPAPAPARATPPASALTVTPPPPMILLPGGMELFDAADIGKIKGSGSSDAGEGRGDSVAASGPGEGPGGQKLYNAEWYREPSDAELNGFLPNGAPPGSWALIACRTIEDYHVDNCRSLGEAPAGSGLSRAMRQAAWQFRIRPPQLGGKRLVGAWVRIRFDFSRRPGGAANGTD